MNKAKSKRVKHTIDIPIPVSTENGIKIYNQAWGHSLASVIHWLRNHYKEYFDPTDEALLVEYMKDCWSRKTYRSSLGSVKNASD